MTSREGAGVFITLEGGEGTGKSTQVRRLAQRLGESGHEVVTTREPGGSPRAELIRTALLSGAVKPLGPVAEAMMFAAARIDHLDATIRPALLRGAVVISDRFVDSTRVYQGAVDGVDPALLAGLERITVGHTMPDLTLVLDLDVGTGLARAQARRGADAPDRFEGEGAGFHERLRRAFLANAAGDPGRCRVIDASGDADAVAERLWRAVAACLPVLLAAGVEPPP